MNGIKDVGTEAAILRQTLSRFARLGSSAFGIMPVGATQMEESVRLITAIFGLAGLLLGAISMPAAATPVEPPPPPDDVTVIDQQGGLITFSGPLGRLYAEVGTDYFIAAGGLVTDVCSGLPPETVGVSRQVGDGTWHSKIPNGGVERDLYVYLKDPGLDVGGYLTSVCSSIATGGPAPTPYATGTAVQRAAQRNLDSPYWTYTGPQPPGTYRNGVRGTAVTEDGLELRVLTAVYYEVLDDGSLDVFYERTVVQPVG